MKMNVIIVLVILTAIIQVATPSYNLYEYLEEGDWDIANNANTHMCSETEEYEEKVEIPFNHTFTVSYTAFCFRSFSLRCTKFRNETKELFKTVSVLKTRTAVKCCQGYEQLKGICTAICPEKCVNGKCDNPNECDCDLGWKGKVCTEECEEGWFGKNCGIPCNCNNDATCDRFDGKCYCKKGYTGIYCETAVHDENSSKDCADQCQCKNGGNLSEPGICQCLPGYYGKYCEKLCQAGTFGENCSLNCSCEVANTEMCSPINGMCHCEPGWEGDNCDKPCDLGNWGWNCEQKCNCGSNGTCHSVTGVCQCRPGWHGLNCESICPPGFYSQDCKMKCPDCNHEPGICHHETGWCNCPHGVTGRLCDLECPKGKYGKNCTNFCLCNNNSTCDPINGKCSCTPGWRGKECSLPCPDGTFGESCSFSCNCSNEATCDNTDGTCIFELIIREKISLKNLLDEESSFPSFGTQILLGVFISLFVAIVISFLWFIIAKKTYLSNMHQAMHSRLRRKQWFKKTEEKEDTNVTTLCPDDSTSTTQIGQYMNPMYESPKALESSGSRPTSTILSSNNTNHAEQMKDEFDDLPFRIPESNTRTDSKIAQPNVKISFGSDFQRCDANPHPVINYSSSGKTFYFAQAENIAALVNADVGNEHRYENMEGATQVNIPKI